LAKEEKKGKAIETNLGEKGEEIVVGEESSLENPPSNPFCLEV
jgi:hypothetical protein